MRTAASTWWGILLGVALGGFFDGILLHQILQWHHLLSLVAGMGDLRTQVLWDGYFHALMYAVAALGLPACGRRDGGITPAATSSSSESPRSSNGVRPLGPARVGRAAPSRSTGTKKAVRKRPGSSSAKATYAVPTARR